MEISMTSIEMFGGAKWLSAGPSCGQPLFRGEFAVDRPLAKAEITICGLGLYKLHFNGRLADDDLFGTLASDFHAYDNQPCCKLFGEVTAHRVWCRQIDVTERLNEGRNCIGVELAPGWYGNSGVYGFISDYGVPKLCFRLVLTFADGTENEILSDDFMKWHESRITAWSFYYGETQDFDAVRVDGWDEVGYPDFDWKKPETVPAPDTDYYVQDCPPDRVIRYIAPKLIGETDDSLIYDMGENITGTPVIMQNGEGVEDIRLRVSERLNRDGTIEDYTNHRQNSRFITDGKKREYRLRFCWYGFRYASVTKNARIVSCAVTHADIAVNSSFKSDSALLNWIYEAYLRTQLDNLHCGIPSDCPHIEKRGYTGDGELVCESAMTMLDAKKLYRKWLYDISDCQDRVSGHVQYTAPYIHSGGGPGGWGCAIAEVPYVYYMTYGDESVLAEFLPKVYRYFDYLEAHSEDDLVVSDQKGDWCLGDWCTPDEIVIPEPFVNTYFYVKTIGRLIEFCRVTGENGRIPALEELAKVKKNAIVKKYFDGTTGDFCKNVQGANAFAVDIGLGDERTLANMVAHYRKECWYDTGIFGTDIVTRVLFERGYDQLAYDLLTSKGKYGFHEWMSSGCTTFPEYWTYKRSQNHPMFGAVVRYLFRYLLGIRQENAGYDKIVIDPRFVDGLNQAGGFITTRHGQVGVSYTKTEAGISLEVEIPEGCEAVLRTGGTERPLSAGKSRFIL